MHQLQTALLTILCALPHAAGQEAVSAPGGTYTAQEQTGFALLGPAENFDGHASLQRMQEMLRHGADPNAQDTFGDTPLLLLCRQLEKDYQYRHNAHFAQAVDDAFILLLRHGADAVHENRAGCNALFFLQSKPELLKKLQQEKLLPKELACRIPYDTLALNRYMRLRVNQANYTEHEECLQYLSRVYCAPAYDRVEKKLNYYLTCEAVERIPEGAIANCLAFLRLADHDRATAYVDNLVYWQHGEHFIEEIPAEVLRALHSVYWNVHPDKLRAALKRLHVLLPKEGEDMISCNAARPIALVLEMLERQEGTAILPLIREYATGRDPELAYYAYCIMLRQNNLPIPEPTVLQTLFGIDPAAPQSARLSASQRKIYECARVDEAMRTGNLNDIPADEWQRVEQYYRDMGLTPYADTVASLLQNGSLSNDLYTRQNAMHRYSELVSPSPRATLARYILENPQHFRTPPAPNP